MFIFVPKVFLLKLGKPLQPFSTLTSIFLQKLFERERERKKRSKGEITQRGSDEERQRERERKKRKKRKEGDQEMKFHV